MKWLHLAALSCLIWLAGCANVQPTAPAGNDSTSPAHDYPTAPLKSIAEGDATPPTKVTSVAAPSDLWERIRRGFAIPNLKNELVADREQWYSTRADYIQRMVERSSKYLFHIVEELERRNMPTELALLPYIESAFNPQAVSSAKAVGMWQFMPATGTTYDLKQNAFRDDRRDVLASTRAALDYLQKLYDMFGDWDLALAAYNWGEGSVARAIARNEKAGLATDYSDLTMPAETRLYVPKLQAVKNIIAHPEQYGLTLPRIDNHPYFDTVDITRDIDVSLVARMADISETDFRALNPSLHRPVILAAGMPKILLPWDSAQTFRRHFEAYNDGQLASWTVWTVPTTMSVASAAQRTGTKESELRSVNDIPPRMLIKAGSALMVARSGNSDKDVPSNIADNGQLSFIPEITTRRNTIRATKHDSVAGIARRYKVKATDVADWNDLKTTSQFKAGEPIILYLPVHTQPPRKASALKGRRHDTTTKTRKAGGKSTPAAKQVTHTPPTSKHKQTVVASKQKKH